MPRPAPVFGFYSHARDMARLLALLSGHPPKGAEDVLSPRALDRMQRAQFQPRDPEKPGRSFGLRVAPIDGHHVVRHAGWFAAHRSALAAAPAEGLGVVVLINADDDADDAAITAAMRALLP